MGPGTQQINRLASLRSSFDSASRDEKLRILHSIRDIKVRSGHELKRLHGTLCFISAFPDTTAHLRVAESLLNDFETRVHQVPANACSELWDTGIAGAPVHYPFSYETATWLARKAPGAVTIDWDEIGDTSRLDELLETLLLPSATDYFDSGNISTRDWIGLAIASSGVTDFDWLLAQVGQKKSASIWAQLYNAAEISLTWKLGNSMYSKSRNRVRVRTIAIRQDGMRKNVRAAKTEIQRPLDSLQQVSPRAGSKLVDIAMASLAVRHRETIHFNYANPKEVYIADVAEGVSIAVFGLQPKHRYPLECTMGYLILSNGTPIGYGGASAVFRQVNTGINIFDEYRGSEAAYLWVQVMRVYHNLFGCTRFIVNAFQFGDDNLEALQSGAFWFYYRLGYRPVLATVRKLAQREALQIRRNKLYRCRQSVLRRLASCDMHLILPGALSSDLFEERWIETSSMLATKELAAVSETTLEESAAQVATNLARDLNLCSPKSWSKDEQLGFRQLAPLVAAARPASWPDDAKRSMRKLLRAKGSFNEAEYARLLFRHRQFLTALRSRCRDAERFGHAPPP